ncbi:MAG: guanylate cyclase, partial [Leptospiraceae bacterium]|nr:guanylate cyclase [Leptospiraceae bacterium]
IQSFLMIPLILNNEPIGILDFTNNKEKMSFSKEDITRLSILGEQLAGIIYGSNLFKQVEEEKEKSEKLLLNILPKDVASELKEKGFSEPVLFDSVSVMFTDFKGFTTIAEKLSPQELVKDLDACFVQFDKISERYNLEKLKTIGDSYMCAGGIPKKNKTHAIDCILAALEIQDFMNMMKDLKEQKGFPYWELRLGIHSGQLIAGVIGEKKFAYDVWGDTVNTASRMESSGTPGKINISGETYEFVKEFFDCEYRGEVSAKNKGMIQMYYVNGLKKEFSKGSDTRAPNGRFWEVYGK